MDHGSSSILVLIYRRPSLFLEWYRLRLGLSVLRHYWSSYGAAQPGHFEALAVHPPPIERAGVSLQQHTFL